MIKYKLSNKEIKAIKEYDKYAKDSFPAYYVNYLGEAFAPKKVYSKENRYSFVRDTNGHLDFLFNILQLTKDNVIELYHNIIAKATSKLAAIDFIILKHNVIYLEMNEFKEKDRKGLEDYIEDINSQTIMVQIGRVLTINERIEKIYKVSLPVDINIEWLDNDTIDHILSNELTLVRNNGDTLMVGRPMIPGLTHHTKSKDIQLGVSFIPYPDNPELFIANIILLREQFYSYHKYIGIRMM